MQKSFEQLDLFGFPVNPVPQPKKKTAAAEVAVVPEPVQEKIPEPVPESVVAVHEEEEQVTIPAQIIEETVAIAVKPETVKSIRKPITTKIASKRGRKSFKEMDSEADLIDVPEDAVLQQKLYYSISEVASWFKVNTSLLRFWENEFDILQPRKTRKGDRLFRVEDVKNLQLIYFLLRQRKFSIDGAKNYLKNNKREADTQAQLVQSLTKFRSFLLELKSTLGD